MPQVDSLPSKRLHCEDPNDVNGIKILDEIERCQFEIVL